MKTITIEELLTWAFVHELPKGGGVDGLDNVNSAWRMLQASSWGKITSFAELMTVIDHQGGDRSNYFIEQGEPHDDALAVGNVVADLARFDVAVRQKWDALADWPDTDGLAEDAVARAVERYMLRPWPRRAAGIVSLVVGTAILGREPDWQAEPSRVRMVERAGKPAWFVMKRVKDDLGQSYDIEVDGFNRRSGRPARGAYRKFELSTDPTGDILGRLDYQVWVAALRHIESKVAPQLSSHRLLPSDRSISPWVADDHGGISLVEAARNERMKKTGSFC